MQKAIAKPSVWKVLSFCLFMTFVGFGISKAEAARVVVGVGVGGGGYYAQPYAYPAAPYYYYNNGGYYERGRWYHGRYRGYRHYRHYRHW